MRAGRQVARSNGGLAHRGPGAGEDPSGANGLRGTPNPAVQPPLESNNAWTADIKDRGGIDGDFVRNIDNVSPFRNGGSVVQAKGRRAQGIGTKTGIIVFGKAGVAQGVGTIGRIQRPAGVIGPQIGGGQIVQQIAAGFDLGGDIIHHRAIGDPGIRAADQPGDVAEDVVAHVAAVTAGGVAAVFGDKDVDGGALHGLGEGIAKGGAGVGEVRVEIRHGIMLEQRAGIGLQIDGMVQILEEIPRHHDGGAGAAVAGTDGIGITGVGGPLVLGGALEDVGGNVGIATEIKVFIPADAAEVVVTAVEEELARHVPAAAVGIKNVVVPAVAVELVVVNPEPAAGRLAIGEAGLA